MLHLADLVPLEQIDPGPSFNIYEPGIRRLTFLPDPIRGNRRVEMVPFPLAERLMAQYNRNARRYLAIADDLIQADQDAYVARIVRSVVEEVLTEWGFSRATAVARSVAEVEQPAALEPEVPTAIQGRSRPKKALKRLERSTG